MEWRKNQVWPFFTKNTKNHDKYRRASSFEELVESIGDLSDLETHDASVKFWIPEPAADALKQIKKFRSESINETLLIFLLGHCYGFYLQQSLLSRHPGVYRDPDALLDIRFSHRKQPEGYREPKRKTVYYVPELGKNIFPIKLWIPQRLKDDLERLALHVNLTLSEYLREIVISRLFGHGMMPMRPEMLEVSDSSVADAWCLGDDSGPWAEVSPEVYQESLAGRTESHEIREDEDLS